MEEVWNIGKLFWKMEVILKDGKKKFCDIKFFLNIRVRMIWIREEGEELIVFYFRSWIFIYFNFSDEEYYLNIVF